MKISVQIKGLTGHGKTTAARAITEALTLAGFNVKFCDDRQPREQTTSPGSNYDALVLTHETEAESL